jgi:hypothetical protein
MSGQEHQPPVAALPYVQAARFSAERPAGRAYARARETIYQEDCDLSVYRFTLCEVFHVAILGRTPPERLDQTLRLILASGEPTSLPDDILKQLSQRRAQATRLGPWVERQARSVPPKE